MNEDIIGDAEKGTAGQAEASRKRAREDGGLKEDGCPLADEDSTIKMEALNDPNCKMVPLPPIADQQWQGAGGVAKVSEAVMQGPTLGVLLHCPQY